MSATPHLEIPVVDQLRSLLHQLETTLADDLGPSPSVLKVIAQRALEAGGKRMRPRLVYLAYAACQGTGDIETDCRRYAVAVEYLHTATLLHDDLIDGASLRRGEETAHKKYGPKEAVLTGDLLLARCLSLVAAGTSLKAMETLALAAERVAIGEAMEVELTRRDDLDEQVYYAYASAKTAALFAAAAEMGAIAAQAPAEWAGALAAYGEAMGLAFQVADDALDVMSDAAKMGKEAGADLRAGIPSLPVLRALATLGDDPRGALLRQILTREVEGEALEAALPEAVEVVRAVGAPEAIEVARAHVAEALEALSPLPEGPAVTLLREMAAAAVERWS